MALIDVAVPPIAIIVLGFISASLLKFTLNQASFSSFINNVILPALILQEMGASNFDDVPWRFLLAFCLFLFVVLLLGCLVAAVHFLWNRSKSNALRIGTLVWLVISWTNTGAALLVCEEKYGQRGRLIVIATVIGESWLQVPLALLILAGVKRVIETEIHMQPIELSENSNEEQLAKPTSTEQASLITDKISKFFSAIEARLHKVSPVLPVVVSVLIHPLTLSTAIGTVWVLAGIPWPALLTKILYPVGYCYTSLALLSIGGSLIDPSWLNKKNLLEAFVLVVLRNTLGPFTMFACAWIVGCPQLDLQIGVLICALPVALCVYTLCAEIQLSPHISQACVTFGTVLIVPAVYITGLIWPEIQPSSSS